MKFFVAGARGMLASDLIPMLEKRGDVVCEDLPKLDICNAEDTADRVKACGPDIVINCAAYTAVDKAESDRDKAFNVNGKGPGVLAKICKERDIKLVHVSTDFVFDGKKNLPYKEDDRTNPLGVYGESKLEGEISIKEKTDNHIIVRTSWLYGRHGNNFVKTILRLASEREYLGIIYDQTGTPTYTKDLAEGIINLIEKDARGTYNFANEGVCSWYDFALEAINIAKGMGKELKLKNLKPILTEEYPTPAMRPAYSVLDKAKYKETTSCDIPHWRNGLIRYMDEKE